MAKYPKGSEQAGEDETVLGEDAISLAIKIDPPSLPWSPTQINFGQEPSVASWCIFSEIEVGQFHLKAHGKT